MMNEAFSMQGYTMSNQLMCIVDGDTIYQVDFFGGRKPIGKTSQAYADLEQTTSEYYDKLVELGIITPQKTQEETLAEMQKSMLDMCSIVKSLKAELEEVKNNGHACSCISDSKNVSKPKSEQRTGKSAAADVGYQ